MTPGGGTLRLLLAGFGNVGRTLAEILADRSAFPAIADLDVTVVGITTGTRGSLAAADGIDLGGALAEIRRHGRFRPECPGFAVLDTLAAIRTLDYDVLVELSPLSVRGRGEPATSHVREALARWRHVVTCNKGPIAWSYRSLAALARERGVALLFEGTVMDGAPVFNLARHGLRGNRVLRVEGLLNSTTNLVLGALEAGASLDEAIAEARRVGVAEADPSDDLDGWDAAVKLSILANVLLGGELAPERVERESVRSVTRERLLAARREGGRLRLLAEAWHDGDIVRGRIASRALPDADPLAHVAGPGSALRITTDLLGTIVLGEEAPDLHTTAYAVISDLFAIVTGDALT